ncbi:hypothetical protein [Pseudomonas chlororaphis]|uniref:hypothetical protein n=1 Tax=Pseudomonas chlororaphis TaxID=587753 RepID=UPI000F55757B|nr:hypothetical protein [Pseudomonas chlororaphis]AZD48607.1 hypothetical protein C4K20_3192 [Pseudomonas chlororaphis subsp. aurantiaca]
MRNLNDMEIDVVSGAGLSIGGQKVTADTNLSDLGDLIKNNGGTSGMGVGAPGKDGVGISRKNGWAGWRFN